MPSGLLPSLPYPVGMMPLGPIRRTSPAPDVARGCSIGPRERLSPAERFRQLQCPSHQRDLKANRFAELIGSDRWPRDALVLAVYPVDDFDLRRAVTDHQRRFYAIPSFIESVGAMYRLVPVSGPSCILPFAGCGTVRRVGFFVDAVNAQVTPMVGLRTTVPSGSQPVGRDRKETFATIMIIAGEVEVKRPGRCEEPPAGCLVSAASCDAREAPGGR